MSEDLKEQNDLPHHGSTDIPNEGSTPAPEKLREYALQIARRLLLKWPGLPSDIDYDLSQQALVRYYQLEEAQRGAIRDLKAYLYQVIRNLIVDQVRSPHPRSLIRTDSAEYIEPSAPDESHAIEFEILLRQVWSKLTGDERCLLELMILDYNGKELALRLGISQDAARQRISRLRRKLGELLVEGK